MLRACPPFIIVKLTPPWGVAIQTSFIVGTDKYNNYLANIVNIDPDLAVMIIQRILGHGMNKLYQDLQVQ